MSLSKLIRIHTLQPTPLDTDDSKHGEDCSYTNGKRATKENGCDVPVDKLTMCNPGSGYGYTNKEGAPCVLLKLNKVGFANEGIRSDFLQFRILISDFWMET